MFVEYPLEVYYVRKIQFCDEMVRANDAHQI